MVFVRKVRQAFLLSVTDKGLNVEGDYMQLVICWAPLQQARRQIEQWLLNVGLEKMCATLL